MKTAYVYNDLCYVLNNFGVASNPIFLSNEDYEDFKKRVNKHLAELCDILGFCFNNNEYQLVVSLKDRETFEAFYLNKHSGTVILPSEIPESTYILSQEMANVQSGYAKHFNYKYNRHGAVFARRFSKTLIETELELENWVSRVNEKIPFNTYDWKWAFRRRKMEGLGYLKLIEISSVGMYLKNEVEKVLKSFMRVEEFLNCGRFKMPPDWLYR